MATRKSIRYAQLREAGFTYKEALVLRHIEGSRYGWFKELVAERKERYTRLCITGVRRRGEKGRVTISRKAFEDRIERGYRGKGWLRMEHGRVVIDVYALIRERADEWASRYPAHRSPSVKRRRSFVAFARAYDRTLPK